MSRSTHSFALLFCLVCTPAVLAQQGKKYAVLVGVQNYDGLSKLKYTEKDVTELGEVLKKSGYKRVIVLTEGQGKPELLPTGRNIRKLIKSILEDCVAGDTVLLGLSGHGVQFKGDNQHYFCPYDTDLDDPKSMVSLREVYDDLKGCKASYKLMLVDACRSDPEPPGGKFVARIERKQKVEAIRPPGGVAALFSCSEGQFSFESEKLQHGVFFHFVIEGLKGKAADKGQIDLLGLARYTMDKVPDYVADNVGVSYKQKPNLVGDISGKLPLASAGNDPGPGTRPTDPSTEVKIGTITLKGTGEAVTALVFSPDGRKLFTAMRDNRDNKVKAWDPATGKEIWSVQAGRPVTSLALSGNGSKLAAATASPQPLLLDAETGKREEREFHGKQDAIQVVAFQPDGEQLFTGGTKVMGWSSRDWSFRWSALRKVPVSHVVYSPSSKLLFAAGGPILAAFNGLDGKLLWETQLDTTSGALLPSGLATDREGRRLALLDTAGNLWLYEPATGKELAHALKQATGKASDRGIAFSPDGNYLLLTSGDQMLRLYRGSDLKQPEGTSEWKTGGVTVAWSPDGAQWAVGKSDGTVVLMPSQAPKK
jgi:WD40 repeat protein